MQDKLTNARQVDKCKTSWQMQDKLKNARQVEKCKTSWKMHDKLNENVKMNENMKNAWKLGNALIDLGQYGNTSN